MNPGFLLDEQLPVWWPRAIMRRYASLTVWRVGSPTTPPLGEPDDVLLDWCAVHRFYLLTNNRKSMPKHLADRVSAGKHVPGIFLVTAALSVSRLALNLSLIDGASFADEYQDQIIDLPLV
jgi:hypothetical protein